MDERRTLRVSEAVREELTEIVRDLVPPDTRIVFECRDPLTTMMVGSAPGSKHWELEARALAASDGCILVSKALQSYLERSHQVSLENVSLIVPHGFSAEYVAPPESKLSTEDGRTHIALVGTAEADPREGRYYVEIIRRLVSLGLVVHSHFHDLPPGSRNPYKELARELADYHHHPVLPFMGGQELSRSMSRYDLMGVFHELDAPEGNEAGTLAVCMPTKAVCGWLYGGLPVVCWPHYRGLVELIEEFGIGFVLADWEDLVRISRDREAIVRATSACLAYRVRFTNEWNVPRVEEFFARLRSLPSRPASISKIVSRPESSWSRSWTRLRSLISIR